MSARARPFPEARQYVRSLKLENWAAWARWSASGARPADIPSTPHLAYAQAGWVGWSDFLGTGRLSPRQQHEQFRPYQEARRWVRTVGLRTHREWRAWSRTGARPLDIPSDPARTYRHSGWKHWGDFLGTGRVATKRRRYRTFAQARDFARGLGLEGVGAWIQWCASGQRPADIPTHPERTYKQAGWAGWGDWLGTQRIATQQQHQRFRPYREARAWVHTLGLRSQGEWRAWCRSGARPPDIPASPHRTYRGRGWRHWGDWLGHDAPPRTR